MAGTVNGAAVKDCQPICRPIAWLVLPTGVMASIFAFSVVQSLVRPISEPEQDEYCSAGYKRGAGDRRIVGGVVVLVAVGDAAVPGAVRGRRPDLAVRKAVALRVVFVVAAGAVDSLPQVPAQPVGSIIVGAEIHVLVEGDDRDIDVFRMDGSALELREQIVGRGLQRSHLFVACHRAGVVEHQRNAKARIAPGRDRHRIDVDLTDADDTEEICVDDCGAVQGQFRTRRPW